MSGLTLDGFKDRVSKWVEACFGKQIATNRPERNHRFLEEALELVQSCGCTSEEVLKLVDYVYSRPAGEKVQELGGVLITLSALAHAHELSMEDAAEGELERCWVLIERIRAKREKKLQYSPLP